MNFAVSIFTSMNDRDARSTMGFQQIAQQRALSGFNKDSTGIPGLTSCSSAFSSSGRNGDLNLVVRLLRWWIGLAIR